VAKMAKQHTLRVRGTRWEQIEKKAWELSIKENKVIKPTDVADAILSKYVNEITIEDVEKERQTR
jgi:hypothetical protein